MAGLQFHFMTSTNVQTQSTQSFMDGLLLAVYCSPFLVAAGMSKHSPACFIIIGEGSAVHTKHIAASNRS